MTTLAGSARVPAARPSRFADLEFHWIASGLFAICVVPTFLALKLPLSVNWSRLLTIYWVGLSLHSVAFAILLMVIGLPLSQTLRPVWAHYKAQKPRLAIFTVFAIFMVLEFGPLSGFLLIILGLLLAELLDRSRGNIDVLIAYFKPLLVPSVYLFFGLVMVFAYNDVIAIIRNPSAYDWLYLKMDSYFLGGSSVSSIAHALIHRVPASAVWAETIYYGMFNQIGAALIIIGIYVGSKEAARYVGTLLTAYFLGLVLFLLWPSMGPFFTCSDHFAEFPRFLRTYGSQMGMVAKAHLLATNRGLSQVDTDYFIAFPCLHIAQPIVVAWYLRRWRRMMAFLIAYDLVLIPAILLLEWHYLVDIFGGVVIAALAIYLNKLRGKSVTSPAPLEIYDDVAEVPAVG